MLSAAVVGVALLGTAPSAHATDITNPAEHPDPITLTIDGQTYRDGADTLPGYDDYACTPIPNVQYDFADNQIQYYDEQGELVKTAHWTEWSRISSYETWVAQQQQGTSPSTAPTTSSANAAPTGTSTTTTGTATTSPAAAAPAATSPATTSPATKTTRSASKTKGSAIKTERPAAKTQSSATTRGGPATRTKTAATTTGSSSRESRTSRTPSSGSSHGGTRGKSTAWPAKRSTATKRSTAADPTTGGASAAGSSSAPAAASSASSSGAAANPQADDAASSTPSPAGTPKFELVSDKGVGGGVADTRPIGIGILVAVFGVACLAFLFGSARRRSFGRVAS
jgi:hypothetical protein